MRLCCAGDVTWRLSSSDKIMIKNEHLNIHQCEKKPSNIDSYRINCIFLCIHTQFPVQTGIQIPSIQP